MIISGLQNFSMIDYNDYLCAIIFTQGCNMKCPFCHNPELVFSKNLNPLYSENKILDFLKSRIGKLDAVVITGGEPLLQKDLIQFIQKIKSMNFKIKLDSNGLLTDKLKQVIDTKLVDYIAMDIKHDIHKYKEACGIDVNIKNIIKSISLIQNSGIDHEFRTTVVEGMQSENDIINIGKLVKNSKYFIQNFKKSHHLDDSFLNKKGFSKEKLKSIEKKLLDNNINVTVR